MKKRVLAFGVAALIAIPVALSAQALGVGVRVGTLGFGAEAALGLGEMVAVRGGVGLFPIETDATKFWDVGADVNAKLKLPNTWYNIGLDVYLGGAFRIGGGMLYRPDDPTITATLPPGGMVDIGDQTYTGAQISGVVGSLDAKSSAPYALIGFGKHTSTGTGLFLDLGLAFLGDSHVSLEATGGTLKDDPIFQQQLAIEEQNLENDLPNWAKKYWPIASLGLRIGIG